MTTDGFGKPIYNGDIKYPNDDTYFYSLNVIVHKTELSYTRFRIRVLDDFVIAIFASFDKPYGVFSTADIHSFHIQRQPNRASQKTER